MLCQKNDRMYSRVLIIILIIFLHGCSTKILKNDIPRMPVLQEYPTVLKHGTQLCENGTTFMYADMQGVNLAGDILVIRGFTQRGLPRAVIILNKSKRLHVGVWIDHDANGIMDEFFSEPHSLNEKYGSGCDLLKKLDRNENYGQFTPPSEAKHNC